jgi:hypothetical protein
MDEANPQVTLGSTPVSLMCDVNCRFSFLNGDPGTDRWEPSGLVRHPLAMAGAAPLATY